MAFRVTAAALLASIGMFVWGAVFWMVLPIQFDAARRLTTDQQIAVVESLKPLLPADGAYWIPSADQAVDQADDPNAPWIQRHKQGPIIQIMYRQSGLDPMNPVQLVVGFVHTLICNILVATLLAWLRKSFCCYGARLTFVVALGLFAGLWVEIRQVVWLSYPLDYQLFNTAYDLSAWLVGGLILAAVVKAKPSDVVALKCS